MRTLLGWKATLVTLTCCVRLVLCARRSTRGSLTAHPGAAMFTAIISAACVALQPKATV